MQFKPEKFQTNDSTRPSRLEWKMETLLQAQASKTERQSAATSAIVRKFIDASYVPRPSLDSHQIDDIEKAIVGDNVLLLLSIRRSLPSNIPSMIALDTLYREATRDRMTKDGVMRPNCLAGVAAAGGSCLVLEMLRINNVDLGRAQIDNAFTPLIWACSEGKHEAVKFLLEHGVEANFMTYGHSAISQAVYSGSAETVDALIRLGSVDVNLKLAIEKSFLSVAIENDNPTMARLLLEAGIDLGCVNTFRASPLHTLAKNLSHLDKQQWLDLAAAIIRQAIDQGVGLDIVDLDYERTPLDIAKESGIDWVERLFLEGT